MASLQDERLNKILADLDGLAGKTRKEVVEYFRELREGRRIHTRKEVFEFFDELREERKVHFYSLKENQWPELPPLNEDHTKIQKAQVSRLYEEDGLRNSEHHIARSKALSVFERIEGETRPTVPVRPDKPFGILELIKSIGEICEFLLSIGYHGPRGR